MFNNQQNIFEHQLVLQYFKYSVRVRRLDYVYTDWIFDYPVNSISNSLVTSYLKNQIMSEEEEERLFHLFQFLYFVKSLELNPFKDYKKHRIKEQFYSSLKFPRSEFL